MGKIAVLGVFMADVAFRAERLPVMGETLMGRSFALSAGGKGSNQAVASARMGAQVQMISRLGRDDFADMAHRLWDEAGVDYGSVVQGEMPTGAAFIFINDASGDNAIIISPGAAGAITVADVEAAAPVIEGADVFLTQLEHPQIAAGRGLQLAAEAGVCTILNPAPATAELPRDVLGYCDYITPNETEAQMLTGMEVTCEADAARACDILHGFGVKTPLITLGARGVYLHGHGLVPAVSAGEVVETTGAGDAFNGAFAAALGEGCAVLGAVELGCVAAGLSVTRAGAAPSMPTRREVDALISR